MRNLFLVFTWFSLSWAAATTTPTLKIITGADQPEVYLPKLQGKKVALLVNPTSLVFIGTTKQAHLVDYLKEQKVEVTRIFAPEHGFRGEAEAGAHLTDGVDPKTGISVVSLYGKKKKPSKEDLKDVDVVIFDVQDVGARFYTYISTLHYLMEACAEHKKQLIVFDRPNPNGNIVDGPVLDTAYRSFVGMHPIPVSHGMTIGEYAQMINGEKWIGDTLQCALEVIKMKNYNHNLEYRLPVSPSPNLMNQLSLYWYPSTCFFEGTNVSLGRGTDCAFLYIGAPWFPDTTFSFTPKPIPGKSENPPLKGKKCYGIDLSNGNEKIIHNKGKLDLKPLLTMYQACPDKSTFFISFFDKLAGSKTLREQIQAGKTEVEIRASWQADLNAFKAKRKKYLLYP